MPRNRFQRMVYAFITVVITVHVFIQPAVRVIFRALFRKDIGKALEEDVYKMTSQ